MKIPDFTQQARPTVSPSLGVARYQPTDMGAAMAPGKAVAALSDSVQQDIDRIETLKATDRFTQLRNWQQNATYGAGGFATLQGEAAVHGPQLQDIDQSFNDAKDRFAGGLSGPAAQKFRQQADMAQLQMREQYMQHATREYGVWSKQVTEGGLDG